MKMLPSAFALQTPRIPGSPIRTASRRRSARQAILAAIACILAVNIGFALLLEQGPLRVRDPEYGLRAQHIRNRIHEHSGRSKVVVIGSSRTAIGVSPAAYERGAKPDAPMILNASLTGAGPVMQLIALRRLLHDGIVPDVVLLEYWPPFFHGDGEYHEELRFDLTRLRDCDIPVVQRYFTHPEITLTLMKQAQAVPLSSHRKSLLAQWFPNWLPHADQSSATWKAIDSWGWLASPVHSQPANEQAIRAAVASFYVPLFANYRVTAHCHQAYCEAIALCRSRNIRVVLLAMPEASWFGEMQTPQARNIAAEHLQQLRNEFALPMIDAKNWLADEHLPDGFHLTPRGADLFTQRLGQALPLATTTE